MRDDQFDEEHLTLFSEMYPAALYTPQVPPQPGDEQAKQRRRRKKAKKASDGSGMKKRKLSEEQVKLLESSFGCEHKLESERKDRLASELGLDPRQVAVWFQNRRARWKNKKLEEEYSKLRSEHDAVVLDKCRLETEVLKLKEQLDDAQREIQRLSERSAEMTCTNSPSSSLTMDAASAMEPSMLLGELINFDSAAAAASFYMQEHAYHDVPAFDWTIYNMHMHM